MTHLTVPSKSSAGYMLGTSFRLSPRETRLSWRLLPKRLVGRQTVLWLRAGHMISIASAALGEAFFSMQVPIAVQQLDGVSTQSHQYHQTYDQTEIPGVMLGSSYCGNSPSMGPLYSSLTYLW